MEIRLKRAYEEASEADGARVLVDRLWPRGVSKERAHLDLWLKQVAPSTELRKWFNHDPDKWVEFRQRYLHELEQNEEVVAQLVELTKKGADTQVNGARDQTHNEAVVLRDFLVTRAR